MRLAIGPGNARAALPSQGSVAADGAFEQARHRSVPGDEAGRLGRQPVDELTEARVGEQGVAAVVGQRQLLLAEQLVDLVMARTADPEGSSDALALRLALLHIRLVVQGLGNQVVPGQGRRATAEFAGVGLRRQANRFGHDGSAFAAECQAIADGQQGQVDPRVIPQGPVQCLDRPRVGAFRMGFEDASAP